MATFLLLSAAVLVVVISTHGVTSQNQYSSSRPQGTISPGYQQGYGGLASPPQGSQGAWNGSMPQGPQGAWNGSMPQGPQGNWNGSMPQGPGGFGGQGGPQGFSNFLGPQEAGGQAGYDEYHHHLPPFLANATKQALDDYFKIIDNENITKAVQQTQLQNWAAAQGAAIAQAFKDWQNKENEMKQQASQKSKEIIQNATTVTQKIETIRNDMSLTTKQERDKLSAIYTNTSRAVMEVVQAIERGSNTQDNGMTNSPAGAPNMGNSGVFWGGNVPSM